MIEWIITSCALIVIVLLLRFALKDRISLGLQYALWLLVLARLLIPVNFFSSPMSIMNAVPQPEPAPTVALPQETPEHADLELPQPQLPQVDYSAPTVEQTPVQPTVSVIPNLSKQNTPTVEQTPTLSLKQILLGIWVLGMAVCCAVIAAANIRFALRLKRSRQKAASDYGLPVYITGIIDTPCLFGLFRPAIYLPNGALEDEEKKHILTHELTHYLHLDHIWALLRSLCLVLHWYNPLVWVAAVLSRRDAELACDEATIRRLGEDSRAEYGKTLIRMTCAKQELGSILTTATTMTGSKKAITHRIKLIAKHPKTAAFAIICVVLVATIAVGCTFTGANQPAPEKATLPTPETLPLNEETMEFWFASGAGAWGSRLILNKDGSFTGSYHNTEPSEVGNNYPNGTRYQSSFYGSFEIVNQPNDYSIELQLTYVQTEQPVDSISFEDDMRIVAANAFGIDGGNRFTLYLPNATKEQIPAEGRSWLRPALNDPESNEQLGFYFLYNETEETGFYSTIDQTGSNVDTPALQNDETTLAEYLAQNGLDINAPYLHFTVNYEGKNYYFSSHNDLFMYDWNFLVHSSFKPKEKTGFDDSLDYIRINIQAAYGTTGTIYVNKDNQLRVGEENYYRVPGLYSEIKHRLSFHTEKSDQYFEIDETTPTTTYTVYGFDKVDENNRRPYYLYLTDDNFVYVWSQYGTGSIAQISKFYDPATGRVSPAYEAPTDYYQNMVVCYYGPQDRTSYGSITIVDMFSGNVLYKVNEADLPTDRNLTLFADSVYFNADGSAIILEYYTDGFEPHWHTINIPPEVRLNRTVSMGKSTKQLPKYSSGTVADKTWEDPKNPSSNVPVADQQVATEIAEAVVNTHFPGCKATAVGFHPEQKIWVISLSNGSKGLMVAIRWEDARILGLWETEAGAVYQVGTTPWENAKNLLSEPYISHKETAGLISEAIRASWSRQGGLYYPHSCVQSVFYEEAEGYWLILLYPHRQYPADEEVFIAIDESDGRVVKIWYGRE